MYYYLFAHRAISEAGVKRFSARHRPPIPQGSPVYFNFVTAPDWWVGAVTFYDSVSNDLDNYDERHHSSSVV